MKRDKREQLRRKAMLMSNGRRGRSTTFYRCHRNEERGAKRNKRKRKSPKSPSRNRVLTTLISSAQAVVGVVGKVLDGVLRGAASNASHVIPPRKPNSETRNQSLLLNLYRDKSMRSSPFDPPALPVSLYGPSVDCGDSWYQEEGWADE